LTGSAPGLATTDQPLSELYDVALLDLDGVVYRGEAAVAGAAEAVATARRRGMRIGFVTNNASRTPETVAGHLRRLGVPADPADVVTSAQAAVRLLRGREDVPPGSRVLVLGAEGLHRELVAAGFEIVASADDAPAAVVQGIAPGLTYAALAEAVLAVRAGALWVATNLDATLPTERGELPGNGALVAAVRTATGREPLVSGKPALALHDESVERLAARHPLVVGDRLDTDIAAARAAGCDSLLVLTGVTTLGDLLAAPESLRPTYVGPDLGALLVAHSDDGTLGALRRQVAERWAR
jgi:HAD superfamily hydrolase (TIGR01450 family)